MNIFFLTCKQRCNFLDLPLIFLWRSLWVFPAPGPRRQSHGLFGWWGIALTAGLATASCLNSLRLVDAYIRHWTGSPLAQIMAWRLFGTKSLSKQMLEYNIVNWTLRNKHQWNLNWDLYIFSQGSALENGSHFVSASNVKQVYKIPISQILQCIRQISHRNVYSFAHFSYKIVHCGIWDWCIVGFVKRIYKFIR